MEKAHNYTCNYCYKEYKPAKRGRQKFCSTSCRVAHFNVQKKLKNNQSNDKISTEIGANYKPKVNLPDVTNAFLGASGVELIKALMTSEKNKPATKEDLRELKETYLGGRYRLVLNCPPNEFGATAYFDLEKNVVVFSINKLD